MSHHGTGDSISFTDTSHHSSVMEELTPLKDKDTKKVVNDDWEATGGIQTIERQKKHSVGVDPATGGKECESSEFKDCESAPTHTSIFETPSTAMKKTPYSDWKKYEEAKVNKGSNENEESHGSLFRFVEEVHSKAESSIGFAEESPSVAPLSDPDPGNKYSSFSVIDAQQMIDKCEERTYLAPPSFDGKQLDSNTLHHHSTSSKENPAIMEVDLSTPSVSTMTTNAMNRSEQLQSTPVSVRKARADSQDWIASRQEALNQLRQELEERKAAVPSPSRRHSHSHHDHSPNKEGSNTLNTTDDMQECEQASTEATNLEESLPFDKRQKMTSDEHEVMFIEPPSMGAATEEGEHTVSSSEPPTGDYEREVERQMSNSHAERGSPLNPVDSRPSNISNLAANETFNRNVSAINNVSTISPDKNEIVSILAALYGNAPSFYNASGRSPSPEKRLGNTSISETNSMAEHSSRVLPSTGGMNRGDTSGSPIKDRFVIITEKRMRREQKIRDEMKAKELAECTFHPTISPGTRAMVAMQEHTRVEEFAMNDGEQPSTSDEEKKRRRRELLNSVYDRLYPEELAEGALQKQRLQQEMDHKLKAREEMYTLRSYTGAMYKSETKENSFKTFLSNIFDKDCRTSSAEELSNNGVLFSTAYCSPMAYALKEENNNKRRLAEVRRKDLAENGIGGDQSSSNAKEFRIALFDDFLLRQNAFHKRKNQRLQELKQSLKPNFTPSTTAESSKLVEQLIQRSTMNAGPDKARIEKTQQLRKKHIPVSGEFVKKHTSKYDDGCTFHPETSEILAEIRERQTKKDKKDGLGSNCCSISSVSSNRFENLYSDHKRIINFQKKAQKEKYDSELEGCTFKPQLNSEKNKNVRSILAPENYNAFNNYLEKKKALREEKKNEKDAQAEVSEIEFCTFRPKTSAKPRYVSNMAKDFGVLRSMDYEF